MGKHEGRDFYPKKRKKENLPKTEEHEGQVPPSGLLLNGLLPNEAASGIWLLDSEQWLKAEEGTAGLISCIQPNAPSIKHRNAVADYVQRLITKCFPCQVFPFGSVPLRTYLPDEDINLTAFSKNQTLKDSWVHLVRHMLENEEKNENAEFRVEDVQYIQAEVKIIKCLVEKIVVNISFNQIEGLCALCFLEEVDNLINQNHLFKRSIILIKAWCSYEKRILGAHHGLISTYALEILVVYIFNVFNNSFAGPLEVLYRFLEFYSKFDWDSFCVSLWGPVRISSLPDVIAEPPRKDGGELLLSKLFLDACISVYAVSPGGQENRGQSFVSKHINVIDPLLVNNNLGCSVSKGNFSRICSAFDFGAKQLARLLDCPKENLFSEVNHFFQHTWVRHCSGHCPDAPRNDLRLANPLLNIVSNREIRKGSNETTVCGENYGQPAPEEIPVQARHDEAVEEVQILQLSDSHPNIVRWHGKHDQNYVYLAMDSCICSLDELIFSFLETSQNPIFGEYHATHLELLKSSLPDIRLWKENTHPSPLLIKLMRDIVSDLVNLHGLGIIHGDLKPQNVVIIKQRSLCAKLSGIGNSERLLGDMFSLDHHAAGSGSSGWQAHEQHCHGPQTPAVDMFSLGCILFFCMTGGKHPLDDHREYGYENILKDQKYIFLVDHIPEAVDLIPQLLNANPVLRLESVLNHPLFWSYETRVLFLHDTSNEIEARGAGSDILTALEKIAPRVFSEKWDDKMDSEFLHEISRHRHYNYQKIQDLLRSLRNKLGHYGNISEIQEISGPYTKGLDEYFTRRFPKLVIEVYKVVWEFCREEQRFHKYFKTDF